MKRKLFAFLRRVVYFTCGPEISHFQVTEVTVVSYLFKLLSIRLKHTIQMPSNAFFFTHGRHGNAPSLTSCGAFSVCHECDESYGLASQGSRVTVA